MAISCEPYFFFHARVAISYCLCGSQLESVLIRLSGEERMLVALIPTAYYCSGFALILLYLVLH